MELPFPPPPDNDDAAFPFGDGGVRELPLFPLNVVLFPNMPLPFHVFEERYKEMIGRCLQDNRPFGVVLIVEGAAEEENGTGPVVTHGVGCSARIAHVERLADGRMNILVVGEQRFHILDTHEHDAFRTGITAALHDVAADANTLAPLAGEVERLLRDFLSRTLALAGRRGETLDLPDDPEQLSFATACVLPLDLPEKQELLEQTDTAARLACERDVLLREVARLKRAEAARSPEPVSATRFSTFRCRN
jgi:Lon protease-like protein